MRNEPNEHAWSSLPDVITDAYRTAVTLDPHNLGDELNALSGLMGYWGAVQALASEALNRAKHQRTRTRAEVYLLVRAQFKGLAIEGGSAFKQPTESMINAYVESDPRVCQTEEDVVSFEKNYDVATSAVRALTAKREMLQALAYTERAQMKLGGHTT